MNKKIFLMASCSSIGRSIVSAALKKGYFITLADLLPSDISLKRMCKLKQFLGYNQNFQYQRITDTQSIRQGIYNSNHFIYVTHDYYYYVPSKHKILDEAVKACKNFSGQKTFILPIQYDNFKQKNAQIIAKQKIKYIKAQIPNSLILRCDVTMEGQLVSILSKLKKYTEYIKLPQSFLFKNPLFQPKLVDSDILNQAALQQSQGIKLIQGQKQVKLSDLYKIEQPVQQIQISYQNLNYFRAISKIKGNLSLQ